MITPVREISDSRSSSTSDRVSSAPFGSQGSRSTNFHFSESNLIMMPIGDLWDSLKLSVHFYPKEDDCNLKSLEHLSFLAALYNLRERILPSYTRHLIPRHIFNKPNPTQFLMTMFIIFPQITKTIDPYAFINRSRKNK